MHASVSNFEEKKGEQYYNYLYEDDDLKEIDEAIKTMATRKKNEEESKHQNEES